MAALKELRSSPDLWGSENFNRLVAFVREKPQDCIPWQNFCCLGSPGHFVKRFSTCRSVSIVIAFLRRGSNNWIPNAPSVGYSEKWTAVVGGAFGLHVSAYELELLQAEGASGTVLDGKLAQVPSPTIRSELTDMLAQMRAKNVRSEDGVDSNRWLIAEKRLSAIVDTVMTIPAEKEDAVLAVLQRWNLAFKDICSVGSDMRMLECGMEVQGCLSDTKGSSESSKEVAEWLQMRIVGTQAKLQQTLRHVFDEELSGIADDVHHINLFQKWIYLHDKIEVPDSLNDPYRAGYLEIMEDSKTELIEQFKDPVWLLENISGHLQSTGHVETSIGFVLDRLGLFDAGLGSQRRQDDSNDTQGVFSIELVIDNGYAQVGIGDSPARFFADHGNF